MAKSMTGYGRYEYQDKDMSMTVELKSVNHRYCDVYIRMPRQLSCFEDRIRSLITGSVSRGKVDVFVNWEAHGEGAKEVILNEDLARAYFDAMAKLAGNLGLRDEISVSTLARFPEIMRVENKEEDEESIWSVMQGVVRSAVEKLVSMRETEGEKLRNSLLDICMKIESYLTQLEERAPMVVVEYKEKLLSRLEQLLESKPVDEMRIAMEVAVFADKCCIDEELVRLKSHVGQFRHIIKMDGPIGKKLDFLIQEMNREVNTIGSKANDLEITKLVVELKSEIEKVREQVQNIE